MTEFTTKRREKNLTFCGGMIRLCRVLARKVMESEDLSPRQQQKAMRWAEGMRRTYERKFLSLQPELPKESKKNRKSA